MTALLRVRPRTSAAPYPVWHPMTDMRRFSASPVRFVEGRGSRLIDHEGIEYVSANAALWNVPCGYDEPRITAAVADQLRTLPYSTLFRFGHEPGARLAARLVDLSPAPDLTRVVFATSGGSAVDAALKLVRRYQRLRGRPGRDRVGALADAYHGTLYGSMAVTGENLEQDEYGVDRSRVLRLPTPRDPESARLALALLDRNADVLAGVILEPVLGSAGVVVPDSGFIAGLNDFCRTHDALLIADEVATGFGRTGAMFACEWTGVSPDLVVMSKGINNGFLPLAAVLVHERVWEAFHEGSHTFLHGETQAGNPIACAAALATLDVLAEDGLVERAERVGRQLTAALTDQLHRARGQALPPVGRGLMIGMHLRGRTRPFEAADSVGIVERFRSLGVLVHASPLGFSLFPPLVIDEGDLAIVVEAAGQVFDELELP